uniref:Uncharacterized protein n=1 Tax=Peronospora matthiolae TaxID=2874970 RepID=A0AAV1TYL6_9STRA
MLFAGSSLVAATTRALGANHDPSDPNSVGTSDEKGIDDSSIADEYFLNANDDDWLGPMAGDLPDQA